MQTIYQPHTHTFDSPAEADTYAVDILLKALAENPLLTFSIATGNSTRGILQLLIDAYREKKADFHAASFFVLDEYWPITDNSPISTIRRLQNQLFQHINIPEQNIYYPRGTEKNVEAEIERFKKAYTLHGPLDIAIVGIGPGKTCHIGLNNPGTSYDSGIRAVDLDAESRTAMVNKLGLAESTAPHSGITLGMKETLEAKKLVLVAYGSGKAWGIQRSMNGPISPDAPASFLRYHPDFTLILDKEAASLLQR